jgi:hypothetical protein
MNCLDTVLINFSSDHLKISNKSPYIIRMIEFGLEYQAMKNFGNKQISLMPFNNN